MNNARSMMPRLGQLAVATALLLASVGLSSASAAGFTPDPVDMTAAKKEGTVSWYTSTPIKAAQKIADLFEKESGIKVQLFRSGGTAVLRRFMQEKSAGLLAADVMTISDPAAASALAARGTFVAFRPQNFDKVPDQAKDPKGFYIAQRLNMLAIAVRGDKIAPADRPKTWSDLTDPKYKGQLVMPDPSFTALQLMVVGTLSQKLGWKFYEGLKKNDVMIVQGHQQVEDMLKRGERAIAAEEDDSYAVADRKQGHPIVTVYPTEGVIAVPSPTMIIKGSRHPNAAKALASFMLSDTVQKMFPSLGIYAARVDVEPPPGSPKLSDLKLMPVDYGYIGKATADLKEHFNEIFQ
jgi:iron(III) transport system substrate-binding protein